MAGRCRSVLMTVSTTFVVDAASIRRGRGRRDSVSIDGGKVRRHAARGRLCLRGRGRRCLEPAPQSSGGGDASADAGGGELEKDEQGDGGEHRAPGERQRLARGTDAIQRDAQLRQTRL